MPHGKVILQGLAAVLILVDVDYGDAAYLLHVFLGQLVDLPDTSPSEDPKRQSPALPVVYRQAIYVSHDDRYLLPRHRLTGALSASLDLQTLVKGTLNVTIVLGPIHHGSELAQ
ncbi:hypothetical protein D3C86_1742620 [compost metagenome]